MNSTGRIIPENFAWSEYTRLSKMQRIILRIHTLLETFTQSTQNNVLTSFGERKTAYRYPIKIAGKDKDVIGLQTRLRDPSYLDGYVSLEGKSISSNHILQDFLGYIFDISKSRIYLGEETDLKVIDLPPEYLSRSQRAISLAFRNLRSLSNRSGLIQVRKNGHQAMSHWVESAILYIQCDPRPTLDGVIRVLGHDSIEDPIGFERVQRENMKGEQHPYTFKNVNSLALRLHQVLGEKNIAHIESHSTKPPVSTAVIGIMRAKLYEDALRNLGEEEHDRLIKERDPKRYELARMQRNEEFLRRVANSTKEIFLAKLPDVLSNLRTADAFILNARNIVDREKGKEKIIRKCREVLDHYLPRLHLLGRKGEIYKVLLGFEIESLDRRYNLSLEDKENSSFSKIFNVSVLRDKLKAENITFSEIYFRTLKIGGSTDRPSLEVDIKL